jgi:hypothetical protein
MKMRCVMPLMAVAVSLCWLGTACSEAPGEVNLLRNATFQKQTNKGLPDYWDLHHAAAMTFKDLYDQYGIDETMASPVAGAKVLKIVNSESAFLHLMLWPTGFDSPLPPGEYIFSVYLRADRYGAEYTVYKTRGSSQVFTFHLTKDWKRYSAAFQVTETDAALQPALYFRSKAAYYLAAPQLEKGAAATQFQPDTAAAAREAVVAAKTLTDQEKLKGTLRKGYQDTRPLDAVFEYDYYTKDDSARLFVESTYRRAVTLRVSCGALDGTMVRVPDREMKPESETAINVPLGGLSEGDFSCEVRAFDGKSLVSTLSAHAQKISPSPSEVRVNQHRRFISVDGQPFQIIGIAVSGLPPEWYFEDLAGHGFNTILYTSSVKAPGIHDAAAVKKFLDAAAGHGLKVIVGLPLMGTRPPDWQERLTGFCRLVGLFRNHPAVLGWWAFDEPYSWKQNGLLDVYRAVKAADPYHIVLANWGGALPEVGREPLGTLAAADVYSQDSYPITFLGQTLPLFALENYYGSMTARVKHKVSHVFIQLYGDENAWREPTGDELSFMTTFALMNGSMTSYWDTKSNCRETWDRMAAINGATKALSTALFLDPEAREIRKPGLQGNFFASVWEKRGRRYAIVLHLNNTTEPSSIDVSDLVNDKESKVDMFLGKGPDRLVKGTIVDSFGPYESKVYIFSR